MLGVCIILSFLYGIATIRYRLFPYEQLKGIERIINLKPRLSDRYYERKSFFAQHGRNNYDVVFVGDSLTQRAEWEDLFPAIEIANRGIGTDRTDGVLQRLESISNTNAKKAFVMIGTNDFGLGRSVDQVYENYREIVTTLVASGMTVYIQSTILAGKEMASRNADIIALNSRLQGLAEENDSLTYIDLNAGLARDAYLSPAYTRDGIHLTGEGYAVWKEMIMRYLM